MVNINNKISHDKCNSASVYQQRVEIDDDFDSELFCTYSLSLHLGRIKMSLSKVKKIS